MNLEDLSATDLADIDSVCMEFERRFDSSSPMQFQEAVDSFLARKSAQPDHPHVVLLQNELHEIQSELRQRRKDQLRGTKVSSTPFQSKTGTGSQNQASGSSATFLGTSIRPNQSNEDSASDSKTTKDTEWMSPNPEGEIQHSSRRDFDSNPPETIGPYSINGILARGGMGIVYGAVDTRLDRPVAIKMMGFPHLLPDDAKRIELVTRFEREAKAVAALSHPNIVELYDVGVDQHVPYAVMEFLRGMTLADKLNVGPMSAQQTCQIGMQIAGALATAHAAGVIHRDLKPQNIILIDSKDSDTDAIPRVKLLDFGLSRVDDASFGGSSDSGNQTRDGMILGTPGYMAPEQARGVSATSAADMFAMGCVLYEILHGRPAIPGDTPADRLAGTLRGEVQYDAAQCERSKVLCELISECLNHHPEERPAATDVYARLRQFDLSSSTSAINGSSGPTDVHSNNPQTTSSVGPAVFQGSNEFTRRHLLTTAAGGLFGGMLGGLSLGSPDNRLDEIKSIAVLTLHDANNRDQLNDDRQSLLADRMLNDGEILASALASELSAVDGLTVLPYRPQSATNPHEYQVLGSNLEVDAFLTGSFHKQTIDSKESWVLDWKLVSATDGKPLVEKRFKTEKGRDRDGTQFLTQSAVAADIAKEMGLELVASCDQSNGPKPMAYGCMMKGRTYADPDCTHGLRKALECFAHAHTSDPSKAEPLAAITIASLNLAARGSSKSDSLAHLEKARTSLSQALKLNPSLPDALLAKAMHDWQGLQNYDESYKLFAKLDREHPLDWQIKYQRGLLLTALGFQDEAKESLRIAKKLNPMSTLVKTDYCRTSWYFGWETQAVSDARRYYESNDSEKNARRMAAGFLIDYHEHKQDFRAAIELINNETGSKYDPTDNPEEYSKIRQQTVLSLPYGPFGVLLNQTLFELRYHSPDHGELLGLLDDSGATMFPLLLAQHPAFHPLRNSETAEAFLPKLNDLRPPVSTMALRDLPFFLRAKSV